MPSYQPNYGPNLAGPPCLYPGDSFIVFNAEVVTTGQFSQQLALGANPGAAAPRLRVELTFSAAPGAFEIDILDSDTDINGNGDYIQVPTAGSITTAPASPGGKFKAAAEFNPFMAKFVCLFVKTQPANNPINVTAKISYE